MVKVLLTLLIKQLTEAALSAELDSYLADDVVPNRKNGKSSKTLKTNAGKIELDTRVIVLVHLSLSLSKNTNPVYLMRLKPKFFQCMAVV